MDSPDRREFQFLEFQNARSAPPVGAWRSASPPPGFQMALGLPESKLKGVRGGSQPARGLSGAGPLTRRRHKNTANLNLCYLLLSKISRIGEAYPQN